MSEQYRRSSAVVDFGKVASFRESPDDEIPFSNPLAEQGNEDECEEYEDDTFSKSRKSAYFEFDHLTDYNKDAEEQQEGSHIDNSMFVSEADKDVINNAITQMEEDVNTRKQLKEQLHASTTRITFSAPSDIVAEDEFDDPPPSSSSSNQSQQQSQSKPPQSTVSSAHDIATAAVAAVIGGGSAQEEEDGLEDGGETRMSVAAPPQNMFSMIGGTFSSVTGVVGGNVVGDVFGVLGTGAQGVSNTAVETGKAVESTVSDMWSSVGTGTGLF